VSVMLTLALFSGQGCFRGYVIPTVELQKLDGFDAEARPPEGERVPTQGPVTVPAPFRTLQSADGSSIPFDASSQLWLHSGTQELGGKFRRLQVTPSLLDGVLQDQAQPLHLELSSVQHATLIRLDPTLTLLASLSGAVAVALVVAMATSHGCGIMVCG